MSTNENQEYKRTIKTNIIFGSIKIFKSIVTLLQTKIVAMFLGPSGIGIISLMTSTINTLHQFTTFGIFISGVRSIALKDNADRKEVVKVLNLLSIVFGFLGVILMCVFSRTLSSIVFGTTEYFIWFIIVSLSLLFEAITNAQISIFQGIRRINELSISSVVGAFCSLVISFPLYYFWRTDAIPYVVLMSYGIIALIYYVYRCRVINLRGIVLTRNTIKREGFPVIKLGFVLALSNVFMTLLVFLQNAFIRKFGTASDVGLFQASQTCTYYVLNVVIAIISTDFYPKITSRINDKKYVQLALNQQCEILLILTSIISSVILVFPNAIIKLLYSDEFLSLNFAIQLMSLSLVWRVVWHIMSYVILAYGDKKMYLICDAFIGNGIFFILNILGYLFYNINGIAITYLLGTILVSFILLFIVNLKYHIFLEKQIFKRVGIMIVLLISIFINNQLNYRYSSYVSGLGLILIVIYSLLIFNRNFGILNYLKRQVFQRLKCNDDK